MPKENIYLNYLAKVVHEKTGISIKLIKATYESILRKSLPKLVLNDEALDIIVETFKEDYKRREQEFDLFIKFNGYDVEEMRRLRGIKFLENQDLSKELGVDYGHIGSGLTGELQEDKRINDSS